MKCIIKNKIHNSYSLCFLKRLQEILSLKLALFLQNSKYTPGKFDFYKVDINGHCFSVVTLNPNIIRQRNALPSLHSKCVAR